MPSPICDAYHCSLMGPTDPNRYHMWTGWVGNDGSGGGPVITNAEAGYDWSTYPERLERAGISLEGLPGRRRRPGRGRASGAGPTTRTSATTATTRCSTSISIRTRRPARRSPTARRTGTNILAQNRDPDRLMDIFREDVRRGRLPQVSWIVAPEAYCEHPNWAPDFGAWYVSQVIDILASNPEVWSKTALFVNYDEDGGFFDHLVPPTPPQIARAGPVDRRRSPTRSSPATPATPAARTASACACR